MLLLHHLNVSGCNTTSVQVLWCLYVFTVTYLLLLIFSHLSFCSCKSSTAENCSEEASWFGKRKVKPINKLIGSTKRLWITIPMNATRRYFHWKHQTVMILARKRSKYNVPQQFVEMLLLQNKPWLVRYKKIRAMSFLPSVECGKFKLNKAFQIGKILACAKKFKICATSTLKLIKMLLKC